MRHAVHWGRTPCSQLQTHVPLSPWHPRTKSPPIPCICSRKQNKTKIIKKLLSVVTYHVYSPVPSQAMQRGGTAATSLCQLGSLSGGNAPGGTADVCTPAQMGTTLPAPLLAGVPAWGLLQGGAEPWCPPAILVLHRPSPVPFSWGALLSIPPGHGIRVNFAALNPSATGTKTPDIFLKLHFRNRQQQQGKNCSPAVKVANEKIKIQNWYKNEVLQYRWISFHSFLQPWLVFSQCLQSFKRGS